MDVSGNEKQNASYPALVVIFFCGLLKALRAAAVQSLELANSTRLGEELE